MGYLIWLRCCLVELVVFVVCLLFAFDWFGIFCFALIVFMFTRFVLVVGCLVYVCGGFWCFVLVCCLWVIRLFVCLLCWTFVFVGFCFIGGYYVLVLFELFNVTFLGLWFGLAIVGLILVCGDVVLVWLVWDGCWLLVRFGCLDD